MTIYGFEDEDRLVWIDYDVLILVYCAMIKRMDEMIESFKEEC